jgi:hypothetical protein
MSPIFRTALKKLHCFNGQTNYSRLQLHATRSQYRLSQAVLTSTRCLNGRIRLRNVMVWLKAEGQGSRSVQTLFSHLISSRSFDNIPRQGVGAGSFIPHHSGGTLLRSDRDSPPYSYTRATQVMSEAYQGELRLIRWNCY